MTTLALILILVLLPREVFAYLDPGTGSYIIQIVIATIAGILLSFKVAWTNIKNICHNIYNTLIRRKKDNEPKSN